MAKPAGCGWACSKVERGTPELLALYDESNLLTRHLARQASHASTLMAHTATHNAKPSSKPVQTSSVCYFLLDRLEKIRGTYPLTPKVSAIIRFSFS